MKILLNSYPRTGTTYLVNMLRWCAKHQESHREGEYSNEPEWIIKAHEPILLLASIPEMSQLTIIRDPIDTISSNMFRHTSGLNSNSIWGHTGVSSENKTNNYYDPRFLDGLKQSVAKWKEYAENTIKNKENLTVILFETLVSNTAGVIYSIFENQNVNQDILNGISKESIEEYTRVMERDLSSNPNHMNGTDNRLPVPKPEEYYDVREFILGSPYVSGLKDLYLEVKESMFR